MSNNRDCPHGRRIGKCADCDVDRLEAENEALKAELAEQARLNGMGSKRELRLKALNAELVEALRGWMNQPEDAATYDACMARAEAALAKVEASNG